MTHPEFHWFETFATDPMYPTDDAVRTWFWLGTYPGGTAPRWFPPGQGLVHDARFIQFHQLNTLYARHGWESPVAAHHVRRAIDLIHSPNIQAGLIRAVQSEVLKLVELVHSFDAAKRRRSVDRLDPPWYILRDMMREAMQVEVARLCLTFAPRTHDTALAAKERTALDTRTHPRKT